MQNGYVESFNGRMRDDFLNETLLFGIDHARRVIGAWVADYNTQRPAAYAANLTATGLRAALLDGSRSGRLLNLRREAY
jgi:putative transposase